MLQKIFLTLTSLTSKYFKHFFCLYKYNLNCEENKSSGHTCKTEVLALYSWFVHVYRSLFIPNFLHQLLHSKIVLDKDEK